MGYLKRKLDRARARDEVRALNDRAFEDVRWKAIPKTPPRARAFVRFSIARDHPVSLRRTGIFAACYDLMHGAELDESTTVDLRDSIGWFEENLIAPYVIEDQAIFLFKSEARACMDRIWHLVGWLHHAGLHVEMQTVAKPGRVVYEDENQIAAIPWADSDTR